MINVTVWNEYCEHQREGAILKAYPNGMHNTIKDFLQTDDEINVKIALLEENDEGLSQEILDSTDVLVYWAHRLHDKVSDETAARVRDSVQKGMGVIFLHSAHLAKPFRYLMGTSCTLKWREISENERLWVVNPTHPIAEGIGEYVDIPHEEMYGEFFDIPKPDDLVFVGWFKGGEVFRSGCCWNRGMGKVFYFQPGHETYPIYHQKEIQKIITNAVKWAKPVKRIEKLECPHPEPLEKV